MPRLLSLTLLLSLLLLPALALLAQEPPASRTEKVSGLELDAPQERTRPGVLRIAARVDAKEGQKVEVAWDVEGQFELPVEFDWEVVAGGRAVQLVIPDSSGVIRVGAVASVDGRMTDRRHAKTYVVVKYAPLQKPTPEPAPKAKEEPAVAPKAPQQQGQQKAKVTDVYFVVDPTSPSDDPNAVALAQSQGLRNKLRAAGVNAHLYGPTNPEVGRLGLARYVQDAGGTPAAIFVTGEGKVRRAVRLTKDGSEADVLREAGAQ